MRHQLKKKSTAWARGATTVTTPRPATSRRLPWNRAAPGSFREVGYNRCALQHQEDDGLVHKWVCHTGTCFIRKDTNGLVYRGCADPEYLPHKVQSGENCKYQGSNKALWWFCKGDLCNRGEMGQDVEMCGSPPPPEGYEHAREDVYVPQPQPQPRPADPAPAVHSPTDNQYAVVAVPQAPNNQGRQSMYSLQYALPWNIFYPFYGSSSPISRGHVINSYEVPRENYDQQRVVYVQPQSPQRPQVVNYQAPPRVENYRTPEHRPRPGPRDTRPKATSPAYDPCKGDCSNNPSGLFADPSRSDHFIQCGASSVASKPCLCCKAYYLPCPGSTLFDPTTKVCIRALHK